MRRAALLVLAMVACRQPPPAAPLAKAGDSSDEGHGQLANASMSLMTAAPRPRNVPVPRRYRDDDDDDDDSGTYGGPGYGGASYASYRPPPWTYPSAPRMPGYATASGLTGVIEGTIRWRGATPTLTTACGAIEPVHLGAGRALAGAVVYIERVRVGRVVVQASGEQRPYTVGGTVLKRGCELVPRVQLVSPVPAALAIHGDATAAQLAITLPGDTAKAYPLEAGGRVVLPARHGVTRVEGEDHTLGAAWAIGTDSPYFALTDDRGHYRIEELAPGSYELTFWYPPLPELVDGKLVYGAPIIVKRTVRVGDKRAARLDVTLAP
jgi:hypothetical protein